MVIACIEIIQNFWKVKQYNMNGTFTAMHPQL